MKAVERQNNFNLLRLVLAVLVILAHSPEIVDGNRQRELLTRVFGSISFGDLAVDGFFLLSGYLILQSWDSRPQAWQFLKKRLLRIYPGYIVACLVCAFVVGPLGADVATYFSNFQFDQFAASVALLDIPDLPSVFAGTHYPTTNGAMWTISWEFRCYLFVLIAGMSGLLRLRYFCLGLTAGVIGFLAWLRLKHLPEGELRLMICFLSGMSYYHYRDHVRFSGKAAVIAAAVSIAALFSWRASELVLATIGGYALLYVAGKRSTLLSRFNRLPDVSYGVYLYGWPIQKLILWYFPSLSPWALFALATPAAVIAGTVSWYLIEKPALRFKGAMPKIAVDDPQTKSVIS